MTPTLAATALEGLAALAARLSAPTIVFGALFVPSANAVVDEGVVPGRPDIAYRWAHDQTAVDFSLLVDGASQPLIEGQRGADNLVRDPGGEIVGRVVSGPDGRQTLVADVGALDRAATEAKSATVQPSASPTGEGEEPKLCPDPTPEPKTTQSKNSIAYQEYVSGLPYGLAIVVGGARFDGCDPKTGILLEAKANIDFMFDKNGVLYDWVDSKSDPEIQMKRQSNAASRSARLVEWHAQTLVGYPGLAQIQGHEKYQNLRIVYDPN